MPYKRVGRCVFVNHSGKWHKKGCSKSVADAKKYLAKLNMVEHGVPEKK